MGVTKILYEGSADEAIDNFYKRLSGIEKNKNKAINKINNEYFTFKTKIAQEHINSIINKTGPQ